MDLLTLAASFSQSIDATRQIVGSGLGVLAHEPTLMLVWGITLFVLATGARLRLQRPLTP